MQIPPDALQVMECLTNAGARDVLVVGGFVRDGLLGIPSKDIDIEVYGLDFDQIASALGPLGRVDLVGRSFGVAKLNNAIDVSVPRRENKMGVGHRGFDVTPDPTMSIDEAAARRDFTINAMGLTRDGTIVDPFKGQADLQAGLLRHTSPAFAEDPLRVLRGMQFSARFGFNLHATTAELSRTLLPEASSLATERIWEEWKKWATKGIRPSKGLHLLKQCGWLEFFPEVAVLDGVPQDPEWHPEGDVFIHTCHVVDAAADIAKREELDEKDRLVLLFAALAHDFGKAETTKFVDGRMRSLGHCEAGVPPGESFLQRIGAPQDIIAHVGPLIFDHLVHASGKDPTNRMVRRLANRIAPSSIEMLGMVIEADHSGRPPLPKGNPAESLLELAAELAVLDGRPRPILMGRHLLEEGWTPGPDMGRVLASAFEAQLDGAFSDLGGAKNWLNQRD